MVTFAFLSTQTLIIVLVVALIVFGPQKLPDIGRQLGSAMRELRKMSGDMQRALDLDGHTNNYDYYGSSRYDSASSYSYTPPSDTPLDQYGLESPLALPEGTGNDVEVESAQSPADAQETEPEKPKRRRGKKVADGAEGEAVSVDAGEAVASEPVPARSSRRRKASGETLVASAESTESVPEAKPRRSRRKPALESSEETGAGLTMVADGADVPQSVSTPVA